LHEILKKRIFGRGEWTVGEEGKKERKVCALGEDCVSWMCVSQTSQGG